MVDMDFVINTVALIQITVCKPLIQCSLRFAGGKHSDWSDVLILYDKGVYSLRISSTLWLSH